MLQKHLKDYFIPHSENAYAPHSLQKGALVGMLFLVILSFTITNALSLFWISSEWMVSTVLPAVIVDLTNKERGGESLEVLQRNTVLDEAAQLKAQDMAKNEYFAHYSPTGVSPWYWFGLAKYNFVNAGENLAINFSDSSEIVQAWMESPTHRANIMDGKYTEIGIGTAKGRYQGFDTVYVVQLFGTPAQPIAKTVTVATSQSKVKGEATTTVAKKPISTSTEVLAQAVSLSESVVIEKAPVVEIPAETESLQVSSSTLADTVATSSVALNASEATLTAPIASELKNNAVFYSDFIATTTGGIPATMNTASTGGESTSFFLSFATQPHKILQGIYILIGLLVFFSLIFSIFIEIRYQQPLQIVYGVGMLLVMLGLFYVHIAVTTGALIL